jgi:hypothetical protein
MAKRFFPNPFAAHWLNALDGISAEISAKKERRI